MNALATAPLPWPVLREDFAARRAVREDEVADVVALLLDHADPQAGPSEWIEAAATAVAVACLGDNHLWQDLLLANRGELNAIMRHWFPAIVAKNSGDRDTDLQVAQLWCVHRPARVFRGAGNGVRPGAQLHSHHPFVFLMVSRPVSCSTFVI